MKKGVTILSVFVLLIGLVTVRYFQNTLFYDPLLEFFNSEYVASQLPELEFGKLVSSLLFRYVLNMFLSLGVIWVVFRSKEVLRLSILVYVAFLILFGGIFTFLLLQYQPGQYLPLFYVRRLLIQPILLLLLIPAFYFYRKK
ncbi:exosortase F system-associated protein [Flavobacteriaceae bacterium TK19130]|nr:exosortase F system-associated protein [Thermobacterium salinum]